MLGVVGAFFRWAHPRSRGENWPHRRGGATTGGSSPLTRGKRRRPDFRRAPARLIPAHAGKTGPSACTHRIPGAHPRSRGENPLASAWRACESGSSPLTRGKQGTNCDKKSRIRLIPAHAGKTRGGGLHVTRRSAHPRSRGENFTDLIPALAGVGSSPLTRGKLPPRCQRSAQQRLIPAHAGKTFRRKAGFSDWPAHPRSRGENAWTARGRSTGSGSSPLTRGKRGQGDDDAHTWRLIPAHAGKTLAHDTVNVLPQAHPRSRGENCRARKIRGWAIGSSPLTRGKRCSVTQTTPEARLIPAHAGKTPPTTPSRSSPRAHPRSRGENRSGLSSAMMRTGSSPLTRGKPALGRRPHRIGGLIPAHAGKTTRSPAPTLKPGAHPRSRGENEPITVATAPNRGSSPLTRGKRGPGRVRRHRQGLIPAHAGKTITAGDPDGQGEAHPRSRGENSSPPWRRRTCTGSSPLTRGKRAE